MRGRIAPSPILLTMAAASSTYALAFGWLSWMKASTFNSRTFDLAIAVRKIWGYNHEATANPLLRGKELWADHLEPAMVPLAELSNFIPTIPLLLAAQAVAVALTAWLVFLAARRTLTEIMALLLGAAVLAHPAMQNATLAEFHMMTLALPALAYFLKNVEQDRFERATAGALTALLCREEVAAVLLLWGAYRFRRDKTAGFSLIALALLWTAVAVWLKRVGGGGDEFSMRYSLQSISQLPDLFWPKARAAFALLLGFAFLPCFAPRPLIWVSIPFLANALSTWPGDFDLGFHYTSLYVPFLAFAAIRALEAARGSAGRRRLLACILGAAAALSMWQESSAPWGRKRSMAGFRMGDYGLEARAILRLISPAESVSAPLAVLAHVSERKTVVLPYWFGTDVVVLDLRPRRKLGQTKEGHEREIRQLSGFIRILRERHEYQPVFRGAWLVMLRKR